MTDSYTGAESPYEDGTNAPELDWAMRRWVGQTGGNRGANKVLLSGDGYPNTKYTVTLEEYREGKRP